MSENNIGIVGTRKCSTEGKKIAFNLGKSLSNININTISGLAIGIDEHAHLGSVQGRYGKTIAVLANGLNEKSLYPKENLYLFQKILETNGLIISEYIIGTKAEKYFFPKRNRIISGLAEKIVVVEAMQSSGSFITVDYALEQGKEVFAVPGSILKKTSKGTNQLIIEGANPFTKLEDLLI